MRIEGIDYLEVRIEDNSRTPSRTQIKESISKKAKWIKVWNYFEWATCILGIFASLGAISLTLAGGTPLLIGGVLCGVAILSFLLSGVADLAQHILLKKKRRANPLSIHFGPGPD